MDSILYTDNSHLSIAPNEFAFHVHWSPRGGMRCAFALLEYRPSAWTPTRLLDEIDEFRDFEPTADGWQWSVSSFAWPSS
jgi:hypothetical protein